MPNPVRALRRAVVVVGIAGIVGGVLRLCAQGTDSAEVPGGGWRELQPPDYR